MEPQTTEAPPTTEATTDTPPIDGADAQPAVEPKTAFDPKTIPAEIRQYFEKDNAEREKKYADYDSKSQAASEWESVRNDPRFNAWVKTLNQPVAPKPFEITDDQYTGALTNKDNFVRLIQDTARQLLETQVGPQLQQTQNHIAFQQKVSELDSVVKQYPDFKELDKRGLIEPIIRKYGNISFEDAYWIAKKATFAEDVDRKARGVVDMKKKANVERPGTPPGARTNKVKAKNRIEAMTMTMEAVRAGRPAPEFEEIGDE